MKKTRASIVFFTLAILVLTTFAIAAEAELSPVTNMPSKAGFASPGTFRQGMPAGTFGQGPTGGVAGGLQNLPGGINTRQQQPGAGIAVGEPAPSGGAQCYCIRAPCNCPGSSQGGTLPLPNQPFPGQQVPSQPFPGQQFPSQPLLNQPLQGQPLNTIPASAGAGNVASGNPAGAGAGSL